MGERKALTLMPSSIGKEPPLSLAARETGMLARRWAEAIDPWAPDTARTGNRPKPGVANQGDALNREAMSGCLVMSALEVTGKAARQLALVKSIPWQQK
ncbi:hypothetical protein UVI_02023130 [Ustilaginoidea virens]|uniref:Uncharacterized protein n=1 Tax=Ustilaginoidea virens TaxID=1159556 RepID=A0A1B5L563_USTVR|nr:hypothetical protein UVI_02023130 [Ustilaginoidea virens]